MPFGHWPLMTLSSSLETAVVFGGAVWIVGPGRARDEEDGREHERG